jgi:hypothetical protein
VQKAAEQLIRAQPLLKAFDEGTTLRRAYVFLHDSLLLTGSLFTGVYTNTPFNTPASSFIMALSGGLTDAKCRLSIRPEYFQVSKITFRSAIYCIMFIV